MTGWFFLVSLVGAGYGFVRARRDAAAGITLGRISRAENAVAGGLALAFTLIIWMTDNPSARMPGRYVVAVLVAALIAVDWRSRFRLRQLELRRRG